MERKYNQDKKKVNRPAHIILIGLLIISISFSVYLFISVGNLKLEINELTSQIAGKDDIINAKENEISNLRKTIQEKEAEILRLQTELNKVKAELEKAKPYVERVQQGQSLSKYYELLSDYEDYAKPIILDFLELETQVDPKKDDELWERGRKVYNWIANNYKYCGDKGLRVGTTFYEFQFFSPDELLMSDNVRCGDCDDFATLFAGLMYASGVSYDKVWVVCGYAEGFLGEGGGHCWNELVLSDKTYRIDPTCSDGTGVISILGFDFGLRSAYYLPFIKGNVQCAKTYTSQMRMNPDGFHLIE